MRRSFLEEVVLELHILKVERAKERAEGNSSQQGTQEQKHRSKEWGVQGCLKHLDFSI